MSSADELWLRIATEFTEMPGPRHDIEGEWSGEVFRRDFLEPKFEEAVRQGVPLWIDLDGVEGYATSFLEEAFGGLARKYPQEQIERTLRFKSDEVRSYVDEILSYIRDARK
ncbi:MAG: STAS-like domain-containing protein [Acidobacteriota bacterium]